LDHLWDFARVAVAFPCWLRQDRAATFGIPGVTYQLTMGVVAQLKDWQLFFTCDVCLDGMDEII